MNHCDDDFIAEDLPEAKCCGPRNDEPDLDAVAHEIARRGATPEVCQVVDAVNHPPHYTSGPRCACGRAIEAITVVEWVCDRGGYSRAAAVKYLWRAGLKDAAKEVEDLEKAVWYIRREIERLRG